MSTLRSAAADHQARPAAARLPFDEPPTLVMPTHHALHLQDIDPRHLRSVSLTTYDRALQDPEAPLELEGVGPKILRALALGGTPFLSIA